jgi:hypothetical protein
MLMPDALPSLICEHHYLPKRWLATADKLSVSDIVCNEFRAGCRIGSEDKARLVTTVPHTLA